MMADKLTYRKLVLQMVNFWLDGTGIGDTAERE